MRRDEGKLAVEWRRIARMDWDWDWERERLNRSGSAKYGAKM